MSVVGIDFGYDTCYISVARAGGIETIANDYSMRDSPSVVGFDERSRVMGVSAKNKLLTNLNRTFYGFKRMLGRKYDDPVVQAERKRLSYPISKGPNGSILVTVNYLGKSQSFSPEQITAMLFTKLKETADLALQTKVKDVVISVPVYFTDRERRALLDAATIAGLNVLKLLNDTTSTALAYGIYKQDLPPPEEKARNVIFVDCGHVGIQVSACSFNKGKLVMQACSFDDNCGGRAFDDALAKHMSEDLKQRFKLDPYTNHKALIKLVSEMEKLKKQMSANTNKLPLNIECFMDDKDVNGSIDRTKFEELISPELARIEEVLTECLAASKWKLEDIYSVEVVGGSTRIPAIKVLIEKVFGKTPNTTLNADEAVSRGCALQCAILSPTFKVREFSVTDIQPFPIKLKWQAESDNGDMVVFPRFHAVPFSKMLTFYRRDVFTVQGEYDGSAPVLDQHIGNFEVGEVKPMSDGTNQKVKVKVRINLNGIFTVAGASYVEKHEVEEEVVPMEVDKAAMGDEKKENGDAATNSSEEKATSADEPMENVEGEETPKSPPKAEKRRKTVQKTIELPVTAIAEGSLSRDKLEKFAELEKGFAAQDRQETDRLTAKNAVEEYVYDIRSKICEELAEFIADEQRSQFSQELEAAENWLYEEGEDCERSIYAEKLRELKLKGEPVKKRRSEYEERPAAIEALGKALQLASKAVDLYRKGDEKYAHIDKADMEKVAKVIEEKRAWLDENCATLVALSKTINPPVLATQFYSEKQSFEAVANPILNKQKPRPPKVEEPPPPSDGAAAGKKGKKSGDGAAASGEDGTAAAPEEQQQKDQQQVNGEGSTMDLD